MEDKYWKMATPLMKAAASGLLEEVKLILSSGIFVDSTISNGNTALMYACAGGYVEVVKELLDCGANICAYNIDGHTPLMEAANAGHVIVAEVLLKYGAKVDTYSTEFKKSALTLACYEGHLEMVKLLLESGAGKNCQTDELFIALIEASEKGHVEIARILLDSGAKVNMKTVSLDTPLSVAVFNGHVDFVLLLIEHGANIDEVNDEGYTPLMEAAREGYFDMVSTLLIKGANINALNDQSQETSLCLASSAGHLNIVDLLIKNGANLELGDATPLIEAIQEEHMSIIKYILENDTDEQTKINLINSAFHFACVNDYLTIAELLLHYGANLEFESENGQTPLMVACKAGNLNTFKFLINKNANVNSQTANHKHTPLSLACNGGYFEIVKILLEYNANPFYILNDNSNMIIEAASGGNTDVMELICSLMLKRKTSNKNILKNNASTLNLLETKIIQPILEEPHREQEETIYPDDDTNITLLSKLPIVECDNELAHIKTLKNDISSSDDDDEQLLKEIQSMSITRVTPAPQLNLELSNNGKLYGTNIEISDSINVNSQLESNHDTALIVACSGDNEEIVQLLLSYGANIEHMNKDGFTPLLVATINENDTVIEVLLNNNANIEAQVDLTKNTSLSIACYMGYTKICKLLLEKGANINHRNSNDNTPLELAAAYGHIDITRLLFKHGAEINSQTNSKFGISPLMLAAKNGHIDVVELLLKLGSDVDSQITFNHCTALTLACLEERDIVVSLLINNNANIEHSTKNGLTPLMLVAHNNNTKIGRMLIHKGANVNAISTSSYGDTALTIAAANGNTLFVELLLEKNANVELKNKRGNSPLWAAAKNGHLNVIELLYDFRANVDSRDNKNISCIMAAFRNGHVNVVKWMVKYVSQFPSNQEMMQYFTMLNNMEMTNKCFDCMVHIWRKMEVNKTNFGIARNN